PELETCHVDRVAERVLADTIRAVARRATGVRAEMQHAPRRTPVDFLGHFEHHSFEARQALAERRVHVHGALILELGPAIAHERLGATRDALSVIDETIDLVEVVRIPPERVPGGPELPARKRYAGRGWRFLVARAVRRARARCWRRLDRVRE